jgi:hypothetical protein
VCVCDSISSLRVHWLALARIPRYYIEAKARLRRLTKWRMLSFSFCRKTRHFHFVWLVLARMTSQSIHAIITQLDYIRPSGSSSLLLLNFKGSDTGSITFRTLYFRLSAPSGRSVNKNVSTLASAAFSLQYHLICSADATQMPPNVHTITF